MQTCFLIYEFYLFFRLTLWNNRKTVFRLWFVAYEKAHEIWLVIKCIVLGFITFLDFPDVIRFNWEAVNIACGSMRTDWDCGMMVLYIFSTSWEFPELTSGKQSMISDCDGRHYPWYGSRNETVIFKVSSPALIFWHFFGVPLFCHAVTLSGT